MTFLRSAAKPVSSAATFETGAAEAFEFSQDRNCCYVVVLTVVKICMFKGSSLF